MALRNQPYLPLYVNDFLTDEKLAMCSAESTGVYIRLMCLLHKSETYGAILLKQIEKQNASTIENFACRFAKQMPFSEDVISRSLSELTAWGVLQIDGDTLFQKRMKKDGELSDKRAFAGSLGGKCSKSQDGEPEFCLSKNASKIEANSEIEIEYENEDINDTKSTGKEVQGENPDKPKSTPKVDERFAQFWQAYPRKVGKQDAKKAFAKIDVDIDVLLAALEKQKGSEQWQKDGGQFVPHPATWLNGRRWEDELTPYSGARAQSPYHIQTAAEYAASKPKYKSDFAALKKKMKKMEGQ